MLRPITAHLEEIEKTYGEATRKAYSDFYYALYRSNIDAFVKESVSNGFTVTLEWIKEYIPTL